MTDESSDTGQREDSPEAPPAGRESKPKAGPVDQGSAYSGSSSEEVHVWLSQGSVFNLYGGSDRRRYGVVAGGDIHAADVSGRDRLSGSEGEGARAGKEKLPPVGLTGVPASELAKLGTIGVRSSQHELAADILRRERFVVLQGASGMGKGAMAFDLLDHDSGILEIDPSVTAAQLARLAALVPDVDGRRFVVESLSVETASSLNHFTGRALTQQLEEAKATLVLTVDGRATLSTEISDRTVTLRERPDVLDVLERHLRYELSSEAHPDVAVLAIQQLLDWEGLGGRLAERPLRDIAALARAVCQAHLAGDDLESALQVAGVDGAQRASQWFDEERTVPDIAFLAAATVLDGCTYATVSAHAANLEERLAKSAQLGRKSLKRQPTRALGRLDARSWRRPGPHSSPAGRRSRGQAC